MSVESKMRNAPFEDLDDELEYLANGKGGGGPANGHGHRNGLNGHRRRCELRNIRCMNPCRVHLPLVYIC